MKIEVTKKEGQLILQSLFDFASYLHRVYLGQEVSFLMPKTVEETYKQSLALYTKIQEEMKQDANN